MKSLQHICQSLLYSVIALLFIYLTMRLDLSIFEPIFSTYDINIFKLIGIGAYAFLYLFVISATIALTIASIKSMILFHSYLFNNEKVIKVTVDENYIIRDSFLELSNGRIIPISIRKIVMDKPENESNEEIREIK